MRIGTILVYSSVFKNESVPKVKDLLAGVPSRVVLQLSCYINSILHTKLFHEETQKWLLGNSIVNQSKEYKDKVIAGLGEMRSQCGEISVFDTFSLMRLMNVVLVNWNDMPDDKFTEEQEGQFFKAVLSANELLNDDFHESIVGVTDPIEKFAKLSWPNIISSTIHRKRVDFVLAIHRCIEFLEYVQKTPKVLKPFQEYFQIESIDDLAKFPRELLTMYISRARNDKIDHFLHQFNTPIDKEIPIISRYCIDIKNISPSTYISDDFLTMRNYPIIKLDEKTFLMTNWNFFLEKMGTGLLFDLFNRTDLKNHYMKNGMPDFTRWKAEVGFNFSEKFFQSTLVETIVRPGTVYSIGEENKPNNADFYFRNKVRIALFEYKDVLLKKKADYASIKLDIDSKLTGTKGIGQLKKLLDKLKADHTVFEPGLRANPRSLVVYPIIVVTDPLWTVAGIGNYLGRELQRLIANEKFPFIVKPLTILDIDYFLKCYELFREDKMDFFDMLDKFHKKAKSIKRHAEKKGDFDSQIAEFQGFNEGMAEFIPNRPPHFGPGSLADVAIKKLNLPPGNEEA